MRLKLIALFALLSLALASAQSSAIGRIRTTKVVAMAHRTKALPLSLKDASGQPAGYTVELRKRIAVIAGTTNQAALDAALKRRYIDAKVVVYPSREAAVAALEAEQVDAFASDKVLLEGIAGKVKDAGKYVMLPDNLSFEPYAIALPRNDSALSLEVNRGLSEVFRSPAIKEIFERTFGGSAEPTALLQAVYLVGQIPE